MVDFTYRNPDVIALAENLDRTASAVALKLSNLASLDDSLPQKGMVNASKTDRKIWAEFMDDPYDVLYAFADQTGATASNNSQASQHGQPFDMAEEFTNFKHEGQDISREVPQRLGQSFFRRMILTSYKGKCALTGIEDKRLLNASHISAWKDDQIG